LFFSQFLLISEKLGETIHFQASCPYPHRIRDVLAPYILHSKVPLHGETLEHVRSKYVSGMVQTDTFYCISLTPNEVITSAMNNAG